MAAEDFRLLESVADEIGQLAEDLLGIQADEGIGSQNSIGRPDRLLGRFGELYRLFRSSGFHLVALPRRDANTPATAVAKER